MDNKKRDLRSVRSQASSLTRAVNMTLKTPAHMVVVKKEDKEAKLRELLVDALEMLPAAARDGAAPILRLLAQSNASPVVQAVISLQAQLAAAGVEARVVLTKIDNGVQVQIGKTGSTRQLMDQRCHDAHELLVLSPTATWIGDCMRRDPATRDSFEMHTLGCAETAKWVGMSFDKLWAMAVPLAPAGEELAGSDLLLAGLAGLPAESSSAPQVLTRH